MADMTDKTEPLPLSEEEIGELERLCERDHTQWKQIERLRYASFIPRLLTSLKRGKAEALEEHLRTMLSIIGDLPRHMISARDATAIDAAWNALSRSLKEKPHG